MSGSVPNPTTRGKITCGGCDAVWTARNAAHCSACHRTFASVTLFDLHRSAEGEHGTCLDPETVVTGEGERRLFFREGMWRGPELSAEARERLRSGSPTAVGASEGSPEGKDTGEGFLSRLRAFETGDQVSTVIPPGAAISGRSVCGSCTFGEHYYPARWHTWVDSGDREWAEGHGLPAPVEDRCGCPCADAVAEVREVPRG